MSRKINTTALGIQTSIGNVQARANWMARQWAPRRAKSFTIQALKHTDYHGMSVDSETGYAEIRVMYYTTLKEGKSLI